MTGAETPSVQRTEGDLIDAASPGRASRISVAATSKSESRGTDAGVRSGRLRTRRFLAEIGRTCD